MIESSLQEHYYFEAVVGRLRLEPMCHLGLIMTAVRWTDIERIKMKLLEELQRHGRSSHLFYYLPVYLLR
jgi:hypothetical protein